MQGQQEVSRPFQVVLVADRCSEHHQYHPALAAEVKPIEVSSIACGQFQGACDERLESLLAPRRLERDERSRYVSELPRGTEVDHRIVHKRRQPTS
jgi:hypothetical protein